MIGNRVEQTTTTTGTGPIELLAPPTGRRSFVQEYGDGASARYAIESEDGTLWEIGEGVVSQGPPATLSRNPVRSSNANALVNFPAGIKRVYVPVDADWARFGGGLPTSGGTANAQTLALKPGVARYVQGMEFWAIAGQTVTGAATLDAGAGAVAIRKGDGTVDLSAGDIRAGHVFGVKYDGAGGGRFRLLWPVFPVPTAADAGRPFQVNSAGTAIEMAAGLRVVGSGAAVIPALHAHVHAAHRIGRRGLVMDYDTGAGQENTFIANNLYFSADGQWRRLESGEGVLVSMGEGHLTVYTAGTGAKDSVSGMTSRLSLDVSGRLTLPGNPCFQAYLGGASGNTASGVNYHLVGYSGGAQQWVETLDVGGHFDAVNGSFVAPVAGIYEFQAQVLIGSAPGGGTMFLWKNYTLGSSGSVSNGETLYGYGHIAQGVYDDVHITHRVSLAANDYVGVVLGTAGAQFPIVAGTYGFFSGRLVG